MVRPESWTSPAGASPARVGIGAPRSRPRFVGETRRAERGVTSLVGGSYPQGHVWAAVADIRHCLDEIDHAVVVRLVERRVSDRRVLDRPWRPADGDLTRYSHDFVVLVFTTIDRSVTDRLRGLLVKRCGRTLQAGRANAWTRELFEGHGLYRLRGTIRYPEAA